MEEVEVGHLWIGLDGEMTGPEISEGHVLIQIGASIEGETFVSDIGWPAGYPYTEIAMEVNGIPHERIWETYKHGLTADRTDQGLRSWLLDHGASEDKKVLVPVGFNVGSFDMPFVRKFLPESYKLFSRRALDLNALCFGMEGLLYGGSTPLWTGWKRMAKGWADMVLAANDSGDQDWRPHNAGYDAAQAVECLNFLRHRMKEAK